MGMETKSKPKCMIKYNGKCLIDYTISNLVSIGIEDLIIVNGYKKAILEEHLSNKTIKFFQNNKYDQTNMVYSLFCAESEMDDDLIITYSDIIYTEQVLRRLIEDQNDFVVTVDKNWLELWKLRMEDPLSDAETMKISQGDRIIELGKRSRSYLEIHGQYIGLIKISKSIIKIIKEFYHSLDKKILYDDQTFNNMYMTTFIQLIINNITSVNANFINGGWLEFDTINDLEVYTNNNIII